MATMAREAWTDERLDDLNAKVDRLDQRMEAGFADMREEFRTLRGEIKGETSSLRGEIRGEMGSLRGEIRGEMNSLRGEIRGEMNSLRGEMGSLRGEMNAKFGEINTQFAAQQRMMLQLFGGMFATTLVGFLGVIVTILTQT